MDGTKYGTVAGYDGSPGAAQALRWAAREARARDTALTVCLAWTPDAESVAVVRPDDQGLTPLPGRIPPWTC